MNTLCHIIDLPFLNVFFFFYIFFFRKPRKKLNSITSKNCNLMIFNEYLMPYYRFTIFRYIFLFIYFLTKEKVIYTEMRKLLFIYLFIYLKID